MVLMTFRTWDDNVWNAGVITQAKANIDKPEVNAGEGGWARRAIYGELD